MVDHDDMCTFSLPSASAWKNALAVYIGLLVFVSAPLGVLLHGLRQRKTLRKVLAGGVSVALGIAVPLVVAHGRSVYSAQTTWMVAFLASTFGFSSFFKGMATALGAYPEGADANLTMWLLWYTSLPEPLFAKGKLRRVAQGEMLQRAGLLVLKLLALSAWLTALQFHGGVAAGWGEQQLISAAHLWFIYLWAAFCLDVGALLTMVAGGAVDPPFRNPLLQSRSLREAWGARWNRPVSIHPPQVPMPHLQLPMVRRSCQTRLSWGRRFRPRSASRRRCMYSSSGPYTSRLASSASGPIWRRSSHLLPRGSCMSTTL